LDKTKINIKTNWGKREKFNIKIKWKWNGLTYDYKLIMSTKNFERNKIKSFFESYFISEILFLISNKR
jgi:hypothetical protein